MSLQTRAELAYGIAYEENPIELLAGDGNGLADLIVQTDGLKNPWDDVPPEQMPVGRQEIAAYYDEHPEVKEQVDAYYDRYFEVEERSALAIHYPATLPGGCIIAVSGAHHDSGTKVQGITLAQLEEPDVSAAQAECLRLGLPPFEGAEWILFPYSF